MRQAVVRAQRQRGVVGPQRSGDVARRSDRHAIVTVGVDVGRLQLHCRRIRLRRRRHELVPVVRGAQLRVGRAVVRS
eukprot:scaffold13447_cov57-Phaeocystis_antarctica.AAC.3